jgi:nucleoside 2-deoxyribosyltransferase
MQAIRVYIAAPWRFRNDMPDYAKQVEDAGFTITHRWWSVDDTPLSDHGYADRSNQILREQAESDVKGVTTADVLLMLNLGKSEGKSVEQGIAIALGTPIIAVGKLGDPETLNVFHFLPCYTWVPTINEAIEVLKNVRVCD